MGKRNYKKQRSKLYTQALTSSDGEIYHPFSSQPRGVVVGYFTTPAPTELKRQHKPKRKSTTVERRARKKRGAR